jgi:hypothetical protein
MNREKVKSIRERERVIKILEGVLHCIKTSDDDCDCSFNLMDLEDHYECVEDLQECIEIMGGEYTIDE